MPKANRPTGCTCPAEPLLSSLQAISDVCYLTMPLYHCMDAALCDNINDAPMPTASGLHLTKPGQSTRRCCLVSHLARASRGTHGAARPSDNFRDNPPQRRKIPFRWRGIREQRRIRETSSTLVGSCEGEREERRGIPGGSSRRHLGQQRGRRTILHRDSSSRDSRGRSGGVYGTG